MPASEDDDAAIGFWRETGGGMRRVALLSASGWESSGGGSSSPTTLPGLKFVLIKLLLTPYLEICNKVEAKSAGEEIHVNLRKGDNGREAVLRI